MKFTDIFIRRPILATTISLLILAVGLRAVLSLPFYSFLIRKTRKRPSRRRITARMRTLSRALSQRRLKTRSRRRMASIT